MTITVKTELTQKRITYLQQAKYEHSFWWWYKPHAQNLIFFAAALFSSLVASNEPMAWLCIAVQLSSFPMGSYQQKWLIKINKDIKILTTAVERYHEENS